MNKFFFALLSLTDTKIKTYIVLKNFRKKSLFTEKFIQFS
jgi:hypothetical protein